MRPTAIKRTKNAELTVEWNDGHRGRHTMVTLRSCCPCASCKDEREQREVSIALPILMPGRHELVGIDPVGNYAIQLQWADGHQTGIYTYDYLRQICECEECMKTSGE